MRTDALIQSTAVGMLAGAMLLGASCVAAPKAGNTGGALAFEDGYSPGPGNADNNPTRVELRWVTGSGQLREPGNYGRWLNHSDRKRFYEFHVPRNYQPGTPLPAVLALHGGGGYPGAIRFQSGLDELADQEGFLVVYPAGTHPVFKEIMLYWNAGEPHKNAKQRRVDDVDFIVTVLDDLEKLVAVDRRRVYATGLSNGAVMDYRLAAQIPQHIAAIGPVAGQRTPGEFDPPPKPSVPIIHFHGLEDLWCPYDGGKQTESPFEDRSIPPVEEAIADWAGVYNCTKEAQVKESDQTVVHTYAPCPGGAEVVLWTVKNGGHTWPGGQATEGEKTGKILGIQVTEKTVGNVSQAVDASKTMWEFFQRFSTPAPAGAGSPAN